MPDYVESLVAFYDILGFGEYVRSHEKAEDIHHLFLKITSTASFPKESTEVFGQRFIHFSDTVIRTTPFVAADGRNNRSGILFQELLKAVHFQMELVWEELVWLRGAMTCGLAFHGASEVYGPAVMHAYELERNVAVFPRIILDPVLLSHFENEPTLRSRHNDLKEEREYCFSMLRRGADGVWFIDYLHAAEQEADYADYYPEFLARHKKMILRELSKKSVMDRVSQKYTWLTQYHNSTIRRLSKSNGGVMSPELEGLLISSEDSPLYYTRPKAIS